MIPRRLVLCAAAASALLLVAGCDRVPGLGGGKPAFQAIDITGAEYGRERR